MNTHESRYLAYGSVPTSPLGERIIKQPTGHQHRLARLLGRAAIFVETPRQAIHEISHPNRSITMQINQHASNHPTPIRNTERLSEIDEQDLDNRRTPEKR